MRDSPPDYLAALDQSVAGMRMLWIERPGDVTELDPEVLAVARTAAMRFAEAGAAVDPSPKPLGVDEWFDAFYTIMDVDRYAALGQRLYEDPSVRGLLSDYAREHFSRAGTITAVEYARAMQTRFRMIHQLEQLLEGYDVALSPTVGIVAPVTTGPIKRPPLVAFTFFVNYAGYTAATIPCGFVGGMPVGLQVIGRPNREDLVLQVGRAFERLQPWATLHPPHAA